MILYLHGMNSSPASLKARLTLDYMRRRLKRTDILCPQLHWHPEEAFKQIETLIQTAETSLKGIIGSSMGGFLATFFAERYGCRAVLINPVADALERAPAYLGTHTNYHTQETYTLEASSLDALKNLTVPVTHPERYWLFASTGDNVLNYLDAIEKFQGSRMTIIKGDHHSFEAFTRYLPLMIPFLDAG